MPLVARTVMISMLFSVAALAQGASTAPSTTTTPKLATTPKRDRLGLTVPAESEGYCLRQQAPPNLTILAGKELPAAVIGDSPIDSRMVIVIRDPNSKMTMLTDMHSYVYGDGAFDHIIRSVNIDMNGVMVGRDADPDLSNVPKASVAMSADDRKKVLDALYAGTWKLDSLEQKTVRGILAWYDRICPAPKP